ncbi:hypothetical protein ZOSMA_41G00550 [Zostera marina]|uniref:Uncharacterized protein n=1 Tax=Zostera marina TaxID=29655 RepID=A0A0K9P2D9_ZOSMR|nr:hypothetical protein ZOSMA_41G00550 [Zostera marina]
MNSTELMLVADVPYCDCETLAVRQIACRRENDDDHDKTELTDLKYQTCCLQRTLVSRLQLMDISLSFGRFRKMWPEH